MRKLTLMEWAAVAEIIATVAVIISLVFVAQSINHNSAIMQSNNDSFLYELQHARIREFFTMPGTASIYMKRRHGEELTAEEREIYFWDKALELSIWEIAFSRFRDGQFSNKQWQSWNAYFSQAFTTEMYSQQSWQEVRNYFPEDFRAHVDGVYAGKP